MTDYQSLELVVIYADIVGSTKIVSKLSKEQVPVFYKIFLNELIRVINDFGGTVDKTVGDEVIGLFIVPETGWIPIIDNSIRCASYMLDIVKHAMSPVAQSLSLPRIQCRIGMDYGEVHLIDIGTEGIFLSTEVLGHVMNIAAKIRAQAQPDEITLGDNLRQQLHTSYKLCCEEINPIKIDCLEYKVFRLKI